MTTKFYDESFFSKSISEDCEYYIKDKNGDQKLLFCLKKNVIDKEKWTEIMKQIYHKNLLQSNNRNIESSNDRKKQSLSGIVGYYDKIPLEWKRELPFYWAGRQTKYTRTKKKDFEKVKKLATLVEKMYKQTFPDIYKNHKIESSKIIPELKIGKTVFTTCTMNKNLRTSAHRDKGDLDDVLSCLLCLGENFTGCKLGFPEHKVIVDVQPGDLIFMNSKEIHCNTELNLKNKQSVRYSIIFYTRKNMYKLKNKVTMKMVSDDIYLSDEDFKRYKQLKK